MTNSRVKDFLPGLQVLNARQHVQVTSGVLLNHVHDIVGSQALFEPPLWHQEAHDAGGGRGGETSLLNVSRDRKTNDQITADISE